MRSSAQGTAVYALGGSGARGAVLEVDRWIREPRIGPRGTAGAVVYRGGIFVFGGESQAAERTLDAVLRLTLATSRR